MRDIRTDIGKLFNQYSHNVVYVRRDLRFRCDCYSERSGESTAGCPKCFGTSYLVKIEKQRCRRKLNSVPESLSNNMQSSGYGIVMPKQYVYYFEHFVSPKEGDLILEVEWSEGRPKKIRQKQVISVAEPLQGYEGRTEFWTTYLKYSYGGAEDDQAISPH